jgi:hypothetical protein
MCFAASYLCESLMAETVYCKGFGEIMRVLDNFRASFFLYLAMAGRKAFEIGHIVWTPFPSFRA